MDALIKSLRPGKAPDLKPSEVKSPDVNPETRPAELDPAEFLAAAVRADLPRPSRAEAEQAVHTLLSYIGENPGREGLLDTPRRVVEAFDELYQGYHQCPAEVLDRTFGETAGYDDFVLIRDIEFTSQCEHHMMPFYGRAHIAYTPVERVVGLSKLARLTDIFARRLQPQEHLTAQIAAATGDVLMVAHMNDEALRRTIASGEAWYFSRSRNALWRKGETSGQTQRVVEMRTDCDQDAVWIRVEQIGAACHTGRRSCFYRKIEAADGSTRLSFVDAGRQFDPASVYRK